MEEWSKGEVKLKVSLHEKKIFEICYFYGLILKPSADGCHKKYKKNPGTCRIFRKSI